LWNGNLVAVAKRIYASLDDIVKAGRLLHEQGIKLPKDILFSESEEVEKMEKKKSRKGM
jgi:polyhydroxyalkanoate synthesis regulator phasin